MAGTATKHLHPPVYLDEARNHQRSTGANATVSISQATGALQNGLGGNIELVLVAPVNCFWRLHAATIWLHVAAGSGGAANGSGWAAPRTYIDLSPPDLDASSAIGHLDTMLHSDATDWRHVSMAGCFRLAGGTTYTATLNKTAGGVAGLVQHASHPVHTHLHGYTFGHGSF